MRLNLTEFFYDCITNTKTTKNTIYVVTSCGCDINDLESFSDQTDTKFWPIISFKLAKNSHKFFYQLTIWFLKEEIHYVGNNLCLQWLTSLLICIFFYLVTSLVSVLYHGPAQMTYTVFGKNRIVFAVCRAAGMRFFFRTRWRSHSNMSIIMNKVWVNMIVPILPG